MEIKKIKEAYLILTSKCNYNCYFCCRHIEKENIKNNIMDKIIIFLNNILNQEDSYLYITGGEPTISTHFFNIIEEVNFKTMMFNTNTSFSFDFIKKMLKIFKNNNKICQIKSTFHAEYMEPNEFYEKIKYLYDNNIYIRINIIFDLEKNSILKKYFPIYKKIKNDFSDILIRCTPINFDKIDEELLILFKNDVYKRCTDKNKLKNFNNCYSNNLCIDYNGNIFQCINATIQENKMMPLYNIENMEHLKIHNALCKINMKCKCNWCASNLDKYN